MLTSERGALVQRKEAIKLKEEYHTFRDRSGVMLFGAASVLLVGLLRADAKRQAGEPFSLTPPFMVGVQAFLAWLLYFYTALALRENVLKVSPHSLTDHPGRLHTRAAVPSEAAAHGQTSGKDISVHPIIPSGELAPLHW